MRPPLITTLPPALVCKELASTACVKVVTPVLLTSKPPSLPESPKVSVNNTAPEPVLICKDCAMPDTWLFSLPENVRLESVVFKVVDRDALSSNTFSP